MKKEKQHNCVSKDELLIQTKINIDKYGLQVITVNSSDYSPSFAYSIGLFETYKQPEVICFGLPEKLGQAIINDVAELIKNSENIKTYSNYHNIFKDSRAEFIPVDKRYIADYFGAALNYYDKTEFPAVQLVWTDRNNKFPWEENFEEKFLYDQPLLDRNADFKFREAKNLRIFTTRQWLELDQPILRVVHDTDGDWQFLTGDQMPEDIRLVALEEMIISDSTLNEAFDLDYGYSMDRNFIGDEWIRTKSEEEDNEE
ncbi:DUF4262 domain-containing protein [Chryseobacterium indologenes]|uniref:DUF4262 domain-containing protein n=1 Tax=Chryseobacterium indologenes TaxID=253 RepID=UPI001BD1B9AA|nr:DUF4262 domain-containing protein [Chryseobacterium indologenes]